MTSRYQEGYVRGHKKGMEDCEAEIEQLRAALELARTCILASQLWLTRDEPHWRSQAVNDGNVKALKQIDRALDEGLPTADDVRGILKEQK